MEKENKVGQFTLPNFKTYSKSAAAKTVGIGEKMNVLPNRMEQSSEIHSKNMINWFLTKAPGQSNVE